MPILVLAPDVAAKIAAGEVVERPASVVKELLDNSIDAGATWIRVEIKGGGGQLIRVTDNGCGISPEELPLALERHATSKIVSVCDLSSVQTLGFRGEALASIAAVAEVTLISRTSEHNSARYLTVRGGHLVDHGSRGAPIGTCVVVRALFREVPARLKFLRSISTETSQISQVVCQYAMAFPHLRISLMSENRLLFQSPGTGSLKDVLTVLYGTEASESLIAIESEEVGPPTIAISGFVSQPSVHRATRAYLSFFVNQRWVRNRSLSFALEEAYHQLLPEGRHPIAAVHLRMPPEEVDVNVHPAKLEVRFLREGTVFSALQRGVRRALLDGMEVSSLLSQPTVTPTCFESLEIALPVPASLRHTSFSTLPPNSRVQAHQDSQAERRDGLRVLGQLGNTFVVAEGPDGMYLVDQHRAHERVLFERMRAEREASGVARQVLLEPLVLELRTGLIEALEPILPRLEHMGFVAERFGERCVLVREIPSHLAFANPGAALQDIFDGIAERLMGQELEKSDWQEDLLVSLACRAAIKSGQVLTHLEMHQLIANLEACRVRTICPHTDPVMVHLSETAIRKQFGRERSP